MKLNQCIESHSTRGTGEVSATVRRRLGYAVLLVIPVVLALSLSSQAIHGREARASVDQDAIVATYDGGEITVAEFHKGLLAAAEKYGHDYDMMEFKSELLMNMVTNKLLAIEAVKQGYVDEEGLRDSAIIDSKEKVMVNTLRRDVILAGVKVAEDEIREFYDRRDTRRLTRVIVLGNKEDAEQVGRELASGADFVEMAEKWSLDLGSATWQGLMAWVRPGDGLTEIEDSIFELPVGEVGGPIKTAQGYYYVRVDSVYQAPQEPYEDQRDYCKMVLRKRKQTPVYIAFMDSVAQAFNLSYDYGTIDMVIERFKEEGWVQDDEPGRMSRIPEFTAEELAKPVFSFKGGTHYLDEYIESVKDKRVNPAFVLAGREEMERGLRPFVRELLVLYLAYDMEMDKARPVRGHVRQKAMEKGVVEMLVDAAGGEEAAKPTNEDRRRYYEENISRYTQPGAVVISMVTVTDEEVVDDLYDDAKTNWSFSEVVSAYRWVLDEERSSERFRIEDREDNPRVFDVARRMEIGAVSEPIPLSEGGYTVMKLLEKESGAVLPFEEVAEEVTLDLNAEILKNAAAAIEEFKQGLREKYNYRVNKEAFEAVNL